MEIISEAINAFGLPLLQGLGLAAIVSILSRVLVD
jgi:hypothetical protein